MRTEKTPAANYPAAAMLCVAEEQTVANHHADSMTMRASHRLGSEHKLIELAPIAHKRRRLGGQQGIRGRRGTR